MPALATRTAPDALEAADQPAHLERRPVTRRGAGRLFEPGRATLDQRVGAAWERLAAEGSADCLVCGAEAPAGGACPACGSELA